MKIKRNDPCPCKSGKKFKKCHMFQMQGFTEDGKCMHPRNLWQALSIKKKIIIVCGRCKEQIMERKNGKKAKSN
jgi:hypothetical protein